MSVLKLRKGFDFRLGKYSTNVPVIKLKTGGVSERDIEKTQRKALEGYGKIAVYYLRKYSIEEMQKKGFHRKVSSRFYDSFYCRLEREGGFDYVSVYLKYDNDWSWLSAYIMGKTGNATDSTGKGNGFYRDKHTQFEMRRMGAKKARYKYVRGPAKESKVSKKIKSSVFKKRKGVFKKRFIQGRKQIRNTYYVVPLRDKKTGKMVFRTLPMNTNKSWVHPAINRFDFIDKAFQRAEQDLQINLEKRYKVLLDRVKV